MVQRMELESAVNRQLAAWSLSGAGPKILVNWKFWEIRTVFGNLGIIGVHRKGVI